MNRFVKFVAAGGIAALANLGSRVIFSGFVGYVPAVVLAYCVGMVTAFFLNRQFVFRQHSGGMARQVFWFTTVNIFAMLQTVFFSWLFARRIFPYLGFQTNPELFAHAIGVIVPVFSSYVGHMKLSFRSADKSRTSL